MNERINKLAEQAFLFASATDDSDESDANWWKEYNEKFAELIVKEMCNVLDREQWNIGRDWICDDGTRIIPKVKEHFGVEE